MRFLVDAQLPPALARWLSERGHEAEHVFDLGLEGASDRHIWVRAKQAGATIVTKDEDFVTLQSIDPNGASIVWIRVGNASRRAILVWFEKLLPQIERALASGEKLVEVT